MVYINYIIGTLYLYNTFITVFYFFSLHQSFILSRIFSFLFIIFNCIILYTKFGTNAISHAKQTVSLERQDRISSFRSYLWVKRIGDGGTHTKKTFHVLFLKFYYKLLDHATSSPSYQFHTP